MLKYISHSVSCIRSNVDYNLLGTFLLGKSNFCSTSILYNKNSPRKTDTLTNNSEETTDLFSFSDSCDDNIRENLLKNMTIFNSFILEDEEKSIFDEIEPYMKRLRYEFDHWDNAIHGFRETERLTWNEQNTEILKRIRDTAFPDADQTLGHVHILDLSEKGHIKPHIDSVRFCGNTIAGLSLLSDAVMRLAVENNKNIFADVLLKRRSLYIMKDSARYDYTHEILPNSESKFKGNTIQRSRRISLMCRNKPKP